MTLLTKENVEAVLGESRNGADYVVKYNPFFPRFLISNGVQELAELGVYWLLDMLATELASKVLQAIASGEIATGILELTVKEGNALVKFTVRDGSPAFWKRSVMFTTFPDGDWNLFEIGAMDWDEQGRPTKLLCHLLSEH